MKRSYLVAFLAAFLVLSIFFRGKKEVLSLKSRLPAQESAIEKSKSLARERAPMPTTAKRSLSGPVAPQQNSRLKESPKEVSPGSYDVAGDDENLSRFLSKYSRDLFQVDAEHLRMGSVQKGERFVYHLNHVTEGRRVLASQVTLFRESDRITRISNDLVPEDSAFEFLGVEKTVDQICQQKNWRCDSRFEEVWIPAGNQMAPAVILAPKDPSEHFMFIVSQRTGSILRRIPKEVQ